MAASKPAVPASTDRHRLTGILPRPPGLWLAALAVLLRVLVPVGFMPAPAAAGALALVLCTGHGPVTVLVDADGTPVQPDQNAGATYGDRHPCPFAGLAVATVPAPPAVPLPGGLWQAAATALGTHQQAGHVPAAIPPPATAPPDSV